MVTVALIVPPDHPPEQILDAARAAEAAGLEELWLWEDCFMTSGVAPASAVLAATERLRVGIGLMPAPLRAPSLTAMEVTTMARMFPGRFLPGLGHGVLDWMGQAGVGVGSPLTLLREHLEAIRALLAGDEVSSTGRYVHLDRVRLRWPPETVPPLLVGGRGPRTLELAGAVGDGAVLDDAAPGGRADPDRVREVRELVGRARAEAGRDGEPEVVAFLPTGVGVDARHIATEVEALADAGATRVPVFVCGADDAPAGGEALLDFVEVLAQARTRIFRSRHAS